MGTGSRYIIWGVAAAVLSGCSDVPKGEMPQVSMPGAFRAADKAAPDAGLPRPASNWWTSFGSPELERLVEAALTRNHDLRAAIARIAQAEAQSGIAAAALYPTLDAVAKAQVEGPADGVGSTKGSREGWDSQRLYQIGLRTNYEIDVWGKNRYAAESALAQAEANIFARHAISLTLAAEVATSYFDLVAYSARVAVAEQSLANSRGALDAVERRLARGDATAVEALQQRTAVSAAEAAVWPIRRLRDEAFNKLAILVGEAPETLALTVEPLDTIQAPKVQPGLPSELLCRRPDIRRAEAGLTAASADIEIARAKMLPSFALTGEAGYGSYYLSQVLSPASLFYSAAGTIVQSLFDAGKSRNTLQASRARFEELVETYRQAVLQSLREVNDSLAAVRYTDEQSLALAEAARRARAAHEMSRRAYEAGIVDYITLLDTERTLFQNEDAAATSRQSRLRAAVDLYKSLGGGMDGGACPPAPAGPDLAEAK